MKEDYLNPSLRYLFYNTKDKKLRKSLEKIKDKIKKIKRHEKDFVNYFCVDLILNGYDFEIKTKTEKDRFCGKKQTIVTFKQKGLLPLVWKVIHWADWVDVYVEDIILTDDHSHYDIHYPQVTDSILEDVNRWESVPLLDKINNYYNFKRKEIKND